MSSREPGHEGAAASVLAVFDRGLLIAIPLLLVGILVAFPHSTIATPWAAITAVGMAIVGASALFGRSGGARWRGAMFTIVLLVTAMGALWDLGPLTGVGALYGISILFAGAFFRHSWQVVVAVIASTGSIIVRFLARESGRMVGAHAPYVVDVRLWIGTTIVCAAIAWLALRVLENLIESLERSYRLVEDTYRSETATREQLERSRADLEELAQAEMVGRLAGGVAHDVNNALAAVLAASDVLASEVATPDQRRHLTELEAACHHAADLVRDLLWTGRRFTGSTTEIANLLEVTRRCLERVRRVAREIAVEQQLDASLDLAVSPEHIEQILFGLIVGIDRTGITRLTLRATRDDASIIVTLDGTATEPSPAARLRAMQAKLSVSAARDLIGQYGGTLDVTQDARTVLLRMRLPAATRASDPSAVLPPRMRTALVVEDEPMVLRRLCQLVARRGYEVAGAMTVAEGIAGLAAKPDLLITDLQLPDGSGEQIALASFQDHPDRPIIVCSGFSAEDITRGPLRDAPLTFLAKPFTVADFEGALAAIARPLRAITGMPV
jgi:CheY-like chemotaxis protein/signal transduction histidine kinase